MSLKTAVFSRNSLVLILMGFLLSHSQNVSLLGAGATFPYPLYSKMFHVYHDQYGVKINYQSIGSGGGIQQLMNKIVDFGASDAFMDSASLEKAPSEVLHIPTCIGAVAITYNLPGKPKLKLSPEVLAKIFMGQVQNWNDPSIQKLNPDIKLPKVKISVVHRSDGSGTTAIFTDYLSKISPDWKKNVGHGKAIKWPAGIGAKGNEGVAGMVQKLLGSIGYVELAYTLQIGMPQARIQNKAGNWIEPTMESASKAAETEIPPDTRVSLTNTEAPEGYPISGFTWLLVYKEQKYANRSEKKVKTMVDLFHWVLNDGQKYAPPLHYAPLSREAVKKAEAILASITYDNKPVVLTKNP